MSSAIDETTMAARQPVLVDLALQGGGSHGAFTWGVLDRLLEEPWIRIEAISGTSAGAMNAAVLADGWSRGGADGARAALDAYWRRVSRAAAFSPLRRSPLERLMGRWTLDTSLAYLAMDLMSRVFSPYDLNPSKLNAEWEFLEMVKVEGRKSAADFLTSYGADLGSKSSADLDVLLAEC